MFNRAAVILTQQPLTLASALLGSNGALGQQTDAVCVCQWGQATILASPLTVIARDPPQPRFGTSYANELCATNHEEQQFLHMGGSWSQELSEVICRAFSNS